MCVRTLSAACAVWIAASTVMGQQAALDAWQGLLKNDKCEEVEKLCTPFASSKTPAEQVEAEKCLANAALCGHSVVFLQGDDAGGGTLGGGYDPEAVEKALVHLNRGIQLAPQDASIHQGRLHLLESSGRYSEMVKALDESCSVYTGQDALQMWLAYAAELNDLRQFNAGLEFMQVLDKHYPHSPDVLGNIGAFLNMLHRDKESISYLKEATELAPKDPINAWDLARAYDYGGDTDQADAWYKKALGLETETGPLRDMSCLYAEFVEKKLHDIARACPLQRQSCDKEQQTACSAQPAADKANKQR